MGTSPPLSTRLRAKVTRWSSRLTQRLLLPFAREPRPDRWIFVLGCYNSGTSLLAQILAAHPMVEGLPDEGIFFTDSLPFPEQFGWPRMWIRCLDKVALAPNDLPLDAVTRIKKQWSLAYPRNAANLVEKSVSNATRIGFLHEHFRPAHFIAIVRNGYAVAEGIRRRAHPGRYGNPAYGRSYPLDLCAEQWKASDEIVTRERSRVDRFLQLRYEDLTADPVRLLKEIAAFLELPAFPQSVTERQWSIKNRYEPILDMNRRSLERLSEQDFEIVERVAGHTLQKYGYHRP
ncbi:MAG: sulfotransferase [Gemmatimonadales bacterium]